MPIVQSPTLDHSFKLSKVIDTLCPKDLTINMTPDINNYCEGLVKFSTNIETDHIQTFKAVWVSVTFNNLMLALGDVSNSKVCHEGCEVIRYNQCNPNIWIRPLELDIEKDIHVYNKAAKIIIDWLA